MQINALALQFLILPRLAQSAPAGSASPEDAAAAAAGCTGCLGCGAVSGVMVIIIAVVGLALFASWIALLVWVARDAKNRGMDNAVVWMIVVFFLHLVGFVIYLLARPQGNLVACPNCNNRKLRVAARCPHCGNTTGMSPAAPAV